MKDKVILVVIVVLLAITAVALICVNKGNISEFSSDTVPTATPVLIGTVTPPASPMVWPTFSPEPSPIPTEEPSSCPEPLNTPTASPVPTYTPTATPYLGVTVTEAPSPTKDPTIHTTPGPSNTPKPLGFGESLYAYVKQSGMYGTPSTSSLGYVGSYFSKEEVSVVTDTAIEKNSTWHIYIDQYEELEEGYDCSIVMTSFGKDTRDQVMELLKLVYPTGYQEVMDLVVSTLRQEIWEYRWGYGNEVPMAGTMGVRYIDGREVYMVLRNDLANLTIHIKNIGVVNPVVYKPWSTETVEYLTSQGTGNSDSSFAQWFRKEYGL